MRTANVRFLVDFRGKLTNEVFYQQGSEADINISAAALLVEQERAAYIKAEEVTEEPTETAEIEPATVDEAPKRRRTKKA